MNPILLSSRLKEETKQAHQELEKRVVLKLKAIRSEADYANFLNSFYNYFTNVEKYIKQYVTTGVLSDYPSRRNSSHLKADISQLGFKVDLVSDKPMPEIKSLAAALGALYVIEGSTMGGPIIVEMLKKYGITKGFSFFCGYGAETGKMWAAFITVVNNYVVTETEQQMAITTANNTFSAFLHYF